MPTDPALTTLLDDPRLWRAGRAARAPETVPAAVPELEALLPGGGWPAGALTEILVPRAGIGELAPVLPALAALTGKGRAVAFVGAPYPPYAPALAGAGVDVGKVFCVAARGGRAAWAAEQILLDGACAALLVWLDAVPMRRLRRLQLAAGRGRAPAILLRPAAAARRPSPAVLRLLAEPAGEGVRVTLLKCRGGRRGSTLISMAMHTTSR